MTAVYAATLGLLSVAGMLALVRIARGPTDLDRIVAIDVLVVLVAAGVTVQIAMRRETWNLALVGSVTLLGFLGSVAAARLIDLRRSDLRVRRRQRPPRPTGEDGEPPARSWSGGGEGPAT
jgi:multicomponent Na+:H+ antiporter subunit F